MLVQLIYIYIYIYIQHIYIYIYIYILLVGVPSTSARLLSHQVCFFCSYTAYFVQKNFFSSFFQPHVYFFKYWQSWPKITRQVWKKLKHICDEIKKTSSPKFNVGCPWNWVAVSTVKFGAGEGNYNDLSGYILARIVAKM